MDFNATWNLRSSSNSPVQFFFIFEKLIWVTSQLPFCIKVSWHYHALNFDRKWKMFSSCSLWKSRKGDWKWASYGYNFNPKWRLKVDPWQHFWAGNSQSGRSQTQMRYLESVRPHKYIYFNTIKKKEKKEKWLNILILACPILFLYIVLVMVLSSLYTNSYRRAQGAHFVKPSISLQYFHVKMLKTTIRADMITLCCFNQQYKQKYPKTFIGPWGRILR